MDADTLIEADGLQRMVRPFLLSTEVVAAGGTIRVVNGSQVKYGRVVKTAVPTNLLALMENLGYRQLTVYWRLRGFWNFLRGRKDWGKMERKGFHPLPASGPRAL